METLIKALPAVLAAAGGSEVVVEAACLGAWKHAVGDTLSSRAVAEKLRGETLVLAVEDRIWQKQLEQMRDQFLFRLKNVLGRPLVKALEFRIAPEKFRIEPSSHQDFKTENSLRPIPIELISAAATIADAGLRKAFLGAAVSCDKRLEEQRSEVRGQRSEIRGQKSEVRGQKSEVRSQRSDVRGQMSDVTDQESRHRDRRIESLISDL